MKLCGFDAGLEHRFFLIAGPCVIESEQLQMDTAGTLKDITQALGIPFLFKSSFDKANRSSGTSFRGPGLEAGLKILEGVRRKFSVPVLTDSVTEKADFVAKLREARAALKQRQAGTEQAPGPCVAAKGQRT
jgi:2-dehydro-3-deoxyphosphooctonate aldolase (KDO 8-P synthase)